MIFVERGLGIEGIEVADAAAHEKRDDILGARLEVRLLWARNGELTPGDVFAAGRQQAVLIQQIGERQTADAFAGAKQKIAPR